MLVDGSDFYCGNSSGSPCQLALKNQVPSQYVHPSTKQCNYSVDLSGYAKSSELNSLKSSVSEGKSLIASAVTDKGVNTAEDASFQTIASNIKNIPGMKTHARMGSNNKDTVGYDWEVESFDGTTLTITNATQYKTKYMDIILS